PRISVPQNVADQSRRAPRSGPTPLEILSSPPLRLSPLRDTTSHRGIRPVTISTRFKAHSARGSKHRSWHMDRNSLERGELENHELEASRSTGSRDRPSGERGSGGQREERVHLHPGIHRTGDGRLQLER